MHPTEPQEIFLAAPPGLERWLAEEAREAGFAPAEPVAGGVRVLGGMAEVWRANLLLRGAGRVLIRIAEFRAPHLAVLDKRARRVDWGAWLRADRPVRVEAVCRRSRIYHAGAAADRLSRAIRETLGAETRAEAGLRLLARIEDDLCTLSLDTSGAPLHKRGTKQAVGKAPLRETLAALFLRAAGFRGGEPVVDPMAGSGTIPIEAAEIAAGLAPGRGRAFAFEDLAGFDRGAWEALKAGRPEPRPAPLMRGYDRDAGAVEMARANAERAGLGGRVAFARQPVSALAPPEGEGPGLVLVNPPYGGRIGDKAALRALYGSLGAVLRERFAGWRAGIVTSEAALARASGLPFAETGPPVPHGSLAVRLHLTGRLG